MSCCGVCQCPAAQTHPSQQAVTNLLAFLSDMAPYYEALCKSLEWQVDTELLNKMKKANEEELKRLDNELEDAEKILGESEIRDAMMAKAEYLCRIGDKVGSWHRLDGFTFGLASWFLCEWEMEEGVLKRKLPSNKQAGY